MREHSRRAPAYPPERRPVAQFYWQPSCIPGAFNAAQLALSRREYRVEVDGREAPPAVVLAPLVQGESRAWHAMQDARHSTSREHQALSAAGHHKNFAMARTSRDKPGITETSP
jgi:hypothetical protein